MFKFVNFFGQVAHYGLFQFLKALSDGLSLLHLTLSPVDFYFQLILAFNFEDF